MASSKSTSDTCSVCGERIDICKKKNTCPIAKALNKPKTETPEQEYQRLDAEVSKMITRMWEITAPTAEEILLSQELCMEDARDNVEFLVDAESTLGQYYLM